MSVNGLASPVQTCRGSARAPLPIPDPYRPRVGRNLGMVDSALPADRPARELGRADSGRHLVRAQRDAPLARPAADLEMGAADRDEERIHPAMERGTDEERTADRRAKLSLPQVFLASRPRYPRARGRPQDRKTDRRRELRDPLLSESCRCSVLASCLSRKK